MVQYVSFLPPTDTDSSVTSSSSVPHIQERIVMKVKRKQSLFIMSGMSVTIEHQKHVLQPRLVNCSMLFYFTDQNKNSTKRCTILENPLRQTPNKAVAILSHNCTADKVPRLCRVSTPMCPSRAVFLC